MPWCGESDVDGKPLTFLHRFVPAQPSGPGFALLLLHRTGGNEYEPLPFGRQLAPGAALLSPRGKVLENGRPRFFRRLEEGVSDPDDVKTRANELADFVAGAARRYELDPARIWAAGFSNGADTAAAMMLLRPETLAGAVLLHATLPLIPATLPDLRRKQVFVSSGRRDPIAGPEQAERLGSVLTSCGAAVSLNRVEGGHALDAGEAFRAREWLSRVSNAASE